MSRSLDPRVWRALSFFIRSREALHSIEWHFCMERLCLASHHGASRHPYRLSLSKIISDLMMVQPGQDRDGDNGAGPLDRAPQAPELPVDLPGGGGLSRWRLQQAAHNGLVAGSSPSSPTTQSCTNPEFPVSAEHSRFSRTLGRLMVRSRSLRETKTVRKRIWPFLGNRPPPSGRLSRRQSWLVA